MCLLCDCQKLIEKDKFKIDLNFQKLKVDMYASISDLMKSLKISLKDMNCL